MKNLGRKAFVANTRRHNCERDNAPEKYVKSVPFQDVGLCHKTNKLFLLVSTIHGMQGWDGAVVRAFTSHKCEPDTPSFPSPKKNNISTFQFVVERLVKANFVAHNGILQWKGLCYIDDGVV